MNLGAFFDIDGTLLGPPSLERRLLRYLRWRHELTAASAARWLQRFLWRLLWQGRDGGGTWLAATEGNKAYLAGVRVATIDSFATSTSLTGLRFFPEALRRLEWHAAQSHKIFLVSGTLYPLAELVARQLAGLFGSFPRLTVEVCATQLEVRRGNWTGEIAGEALCGPAKARALERLAASHQIELLRSYAYGNSGSDSWMLERVGYPAAVNASARLRRLARRHGWPVLEWRGLPAPGTTEAPPAVTRAGGIRRPSDEFVLSGVQCDSSTGRNK